MPLGKERNLFSRERVRVISRGKGFWDSKQLQAFLGHTLQPPTALVSSMRFLFWRDQHSYTERTTGNTLVSSVTVRNTSRALGN